MLSFLCLPSFAIAAQPPAGLKWQKINEITFNSYINTGTKNEKAEAKTIWAKQIANSQKLGRYILLAKTETEENKYTFTMISGAETNCINPPNGDGTAAATPLYATCPMRVIQQNKRTNQITKKDYPDFCYLNEGDSPQELAKNHTEMAIDPKTKMAYFRSIMYGKVAKECNRSIRLK